MVARAAQNASASGSAIGVSSVRGRPGLPRGSSRPSRGGSYVLRPVEGAYERIRPCRPGDWLHAVEFALGLPTVEALRRRMRVAGPETILSACRVWAQAADFRTGRNVAISHQSVAKRIGYAEATVKRIMRFLSRLGLVVEVARGMNWLTLEQLAEARELGAEHQRAVASTRSLTIPPFVDGTPLPLSAKVNEKSPVKKYSPRRAHRARKDAASRRPDTTKGLAPGRVLRPRKLAVQKLAAGLVERLPWLDRSGHIGHVCDALARQRLIERGWTIRQILDRIDEHTRIAGIRIPSPGDQRDPLAYLLWLIRRAITPYEISPGFIVEAEARQHAEEAALRRAEGAERRARIEDERDEIAATIAQMHREFPPRPKLRREIQDKIREQTPAGLDIVSAPVTMAKRVTLLSAEGTIARRDGIEEIEAEDLDELYGPH